MIRDQLRRLVMRVFVWQCKLLGPEPEPEREPKMEQQEAVVAGDPPKGYDPEARFMFTDGHIVCFSERHNPYVVAEIGGRFHSLIDATYRNPHVGPIRWQ